MAKKDVLTNVSNVHDEEGAKTPVANYISQINAGGTVYDIATHHGIKFYNGQADTEGVEWNGITDLEVVIPSITDIVNHPVEFAGTVGANGVISWAEDFGADHTPVKGNLLYITDDCTFGGKACEAGDMAIYDGSNWQIVTGENQVEITGIGTGNEKVFSLTATAQEVLSVEGKTLALKLDYADIAAHSFVAKNSAMSMSVADGKVAVTAAYVGLSKAANGSQDISMEKSIDLPTALADGSVAISQKVLVADNFSWDAGVLPTLKKNDAAISVNASTSINITKANTTDGETGDYVASINGALASASIVAGDSSSHDLKFVTAMSRIDGRTFVSGIRRATENDETADLTIKGAPSVSVSTFVSGLSEAKASGALVSSVAVGDVTFVSGGSDGILRGLDTAADGTANAVLTDVTFGTAVHDTSKDWFYSGITADEVGSGFDFVTSVDFGSTTLVSDSSSDFAASAMTAASVNNHVLSFSSASFMSPVKTQTTGTGFKGKSFTKSGVSLSGFAAKSANFLTGSISQAATELSYKDVLTDNVQLSFAADERYMFNKQAADAYDYSWGYAKLSTTAAEIKKNTPVLANTDITASIPANQVVVAFDNEGALPSWSVGDATGTLTGAVATDLSKTSVSWLAINPDHKEISIEGAYTLVSTSVAGAITVGAAGTYDVTDAHVDFAADTFVTDVYVSDTVSTKKTSPVTE